MIEHEKKEPCPKRTSDNEALDMFPNQNFPKLLSDDETWVVKSCQSALSETDANEVVSVTKLVALMLFVLFGLLVLQERT